MSKAYDRVEWSFLKQVMQRMEFPATFINWVMECVTTTSLSVLVNGRRTEVITPTRGLRQGDPLSPYLFILCSQVLSENLRLTQSLGNIKVGQGEDANPSHTYCLQTTASCSWKVKHP